ncbi:hypothetical protein [Curtobacterium sp. VKM Ac-1393]|uniref:hypothetical protein n=1 Tax=Curtobacterium sp. VKM Ac-1393 TaxID=2783814 RepID=UPI00188C29B1|nr:hypothetical protein [Curtobacterium sp. VKM Ac-1393]MBF4607400.1 hypothetical protein [Curtobacterium sp. VKM Ac-1393]
MTELSAGRRFGTTTGDFALLMTVTILAGVLLPAGGLLAAFGFLLTGVRADRRRTRALFIVAVSLLVLQVLFVSFAVWGPTELCASFGNGPTTCTG